MILYVYVFQPCGDVPNFLAEPCPASDVNLLFVYVQRDNLTYSHVQSISPIIVGQYPYH